MNLPILTGLARASSERGPAGANGRNRFEGENGERQNDHQGKHGITGVTKAQRSLREVIDERKNYRVSDDRSEEGTTKDQEASKQ